MVDPANPLLARVTVNRFWQSLFGTGIVKTTEDFGLQGEWPTHPELLDYLATEFIRGGWDTKAMMKRMVMSGAYRQSSRAQSRQGPATCPGPPHALGNGEHGRGLGALSRPLLPFRR